MEAGLTDILEKPSHGLSVIKKDAAGLGFDFLPAGTILDHPTEILGTEFAKKLFGNLRLLYDIILLDSSPYLAVADVAILSEYTDFAVIVARYHKTDKRHLKDVKRFFSESQIKGLGLVMNQVSANEKDYYYHRYYYYGYGDPTPPR